MSLNLRASRAARVRDDVTALAHVQARLQKVLHDQAAADALLAEATRAADDLGHEARELQDVEQKLAEKLASSRAVLVQDCVSTLPDDVLRVFFSEVVRDGGPDAPFVLAAVCSRWRRVALDSATLWSKIHIVPSATIHADPRKILSTEYDRATILISRSRSAPLDIQGPAGLYSISGDIMHLVHRIFCLLGAHVWRWKYATLRLAGDLEPACLDFLKGPTPLLVELSIVGPPLYLDGLVLATSGYLPFAPRLQDLTIQYAGLGCSARHSFPAMKKLSFYSGACTDDQVLDIIRISSQSLQELVLYKPLAHMPPAPIVLPLLNYLGISLKTASILASTPAPSILTPALAHLELDFRNRLATDIEDRDNFLRFLDAVSPTVRRLTFSGKLSANILLVLARLRNLERLDLSTPASHISNDALNLLSAHDPVIWPRLACLLNLDEYVLSEAVLLFIASRNTSEGSEDPAAARPCRLREVTFSQAAPQWLVAEVQRLLEF